VRERTGLVCDPYFSASKLEWILDEVDRPQAELAFGTVDSWIAWNLTGGAAHVIDLTNASRTMLLDLERGTWDAELLRLFSVDPSILPGIVPSCGVIAEASLLGATVPLAGIAGDQQAALFGQGCFAPGEMKATYGTGTFVLAHVGELAGPVAPGLLKTATATPAGAQAQFAAEGSVLVGGAALHWLRDGLGLIGDAAESEQLAREAGSSSGVFFVPALTGLGSPQWDAEARGLISGITRGTTRAQIVRAALEGMAHQVADIVDVLPVAAGVLRADGGATANGFLMQLQADLIGVPVEVSADADATALGAAALAGLAIGIWPGVDALVPMLRRGTRYEPSVESGDVEQARESWRHAVRRATLPR
jgi:glycerol kinase